MNSKEMEILLVEDDPADAELTTRSLQKGERGARIVHARDGAEALDYLFCRGPFSERKANQQPHAVLLDLKLPRVSGQDVLKAIKADERTRCIPVIVMTSSNLERDLLECYRGGVNSYIQKPLDLSKFQEAVKQFGVYWLVVNHAAPESAFGTE
jgi:two-component system, response regulator